LLRRAKRRKRRHQFQQLEIEALTGRNAPALCQHANVGFRTRDDQRIRLALPQMLDQLGFGEGRIPCLSMTVAGGFWMRLTSAAASSSCRYTAATGKALSIYGVGHGPSAEKIRCMSTHRWTLRSVRGKGNN
jgi:hypothetical protein